MKFDLGPGVRCDLATLIDTRLLIQASSGGGKSWAIRRLLERTSGKVQQLVIDPEGDFHTLREKYDYVYAAPHGGDTVAHPRSAALLAERLLELGASAILDIFELKPPTRREFVRRFLEALVEVPKRLYHPVLVILDEAHDFAPEGAKCESTAAVVDEASRGRKRGQCLVLATQRISKLSKDAAAELKNRMIGGTFLDVDMKRAADELGTDKDGMRRLRELDPGQFWVFGPALTRAPTLMTVGDVATTHPKPGARLTAPVPPTPERVKALLPKLADLPAEAEQKQRTEADLRKELAVARATITKLGHEVTARQVHLEPRVETKVETKVQRVPVVKDAQLKRLEYLAGQVKDAINPSDWLTTAVLPQLRSILQEITATIAAVTPKPGGLVGMVKARPDLRHVGDRPIVVPMPASSAVRELGRHISRAVANEARAELDRQMGSGDHGQPLKRGARQILDAAARYSLMRLTRVQLLQLGGGRSRKSSSSDIYLADLKRRGYLDVTDGVWVITDAGLAAVGMDRAPEPVGPDEARRAWLDVLKKGERVMLQAVIDAPGMGREELADAAGSRLSSSSFDIYLATLRRNDLLVEQGGLFYPSDKIG